MKDSKSLRIFFVISTLIIIFLTSFAVYQITYQSKAMNKCMAEVSEINNVLTDLHFEEIE